MEVKKITNAKIISTTLGYYNHGILTFELCIEIAGGGGCIFGQYVLDSYDESKGERIPTAEGFECITKIMQTVGVEKWEDLKGRYIRVADYELGKQIKIIGNLMEDIWFDIEKFFGERVSRS